MKNLFIVFEGIDGSGKSTQCKMLHEYISGKGINAKLLAEPTSGKWGTELRAMLKSGSPPPVEKQIELFIKDRVDDCEKNITPAMESGATIVMDRYFYSNAAYQGMGGITSSEIINRNLHEGFPLPHRVYFIDISPETAMKRIEKRNGGAAAELFEKKEFLEAVRNNFLSIADERFLVIDGEGDERGIFEKIRDDYESLAEE
ncbi:MAG TPA: dTMP kinase [Spirochaetota bacterium]|nr:dTMP kinase [Spirochaetota bacterium]HPJ35894.1 dTMP kinase [Spirochaetota bacterium]